MSHWSPRQTRSLRSQNPRHLRSWRRFPARTATRPTSCRRNGSCHLDSLTLTRTFYSSAPLPRYWQARVTFWVCQLQRRRGRGGGCFCSVEFAPSNLRTLGAPSPWSSAISCVDFGTRFLPVTIISTLFSVLLCKIKKSKKKCSR